MKSADNLPFPVNNKGNCKYTLEKFIQVLFGLVAIVSFLLFLFLSIPVYLFRLVVIIYAKKFRNDLDDCFGGLGSYFVNDYFNNKTPRANVMVQIVMKGHVTLEELKHLVKTQWIETNDKRFKKFCQYPVRWMGFTFYKKDRASSHVDNHVYLYQSVEEGCAGHVTEKDVTIFSEKLLNISFTPFKSPWEIHLVQNYKNEKICTGPEEHCVLVFKFHHSLTDGFGIMSAFVQGFSQQTVSDLKIPKPRYEKRTWRTIFPGCITEIGRFVFQTLQPSPWKVPDEKKQWHQFSFRSELIPLKKLHIIRKAFGINFSSVLFSAVSSGIQNFLHDSKDSTQMLTSPKLLENYEDSRIYCSQVMPLSGHPMSLANHFTTTFLNLPIRKYDNPIDRLREVNLVLRSGHGNFISWALPWLSYAFAGHFHPVSKFVLKNRTIPFGLTNFPLDPLYFEINGKKAIAADSMVGALDGVTGVAVAFVSYGQYIRLTASAEAALMDREDINKFGKYIVDEIERLFLMASSAA